MDTALSRYLCADSVIDWQHPMVQSRASALANGMTTDRAIAEACFLFVRDQISHSWDADYPQVTCTASQVLQAGSGFCYAKSHLLAGLLRANGIAAGLCYQRLAMDGDGGGFCLHGLNAVWLAGLGWYRLDPRGNKPGVESNFCPPREQLAYRPTMPGERDLPEIFSTPLTQVVKALADATSSQTLVAALPDME